MTAAHKLPALIAVTMTALLAPRQTPAAHATRVPVCSTAQLQSVAYGAGVATGTDYLAIAITNTGKRSCRVGNTITLLNTSGPHRTRLTRRVSRSRARAVSPRS